MDGERPERLRGSNSADGEEELERQRSERLCGDSADGLT